jgi:hypothetical protein
VLVSLSIAVDILYGTILDTDGMNHTITVKEVDSVVRGNLIVVGTIAEVHTIDICRSAMVNLGSNFVLDRAPITFQNEVGLGGIESIVKTCSNRLKQGSLNPSSQRCYHLGDKYTSKDFFPGKILVQHATRDTMNNSW